MKKSPLIDRRRGVLLSFCLLAFIGTCSCRKSSTSVETRTLPPAPVRERSAGEPEIRVAALKDAADLRIGSASGSARVLNSDGQELTRIPTGASLQIAAAPNGFMLNGSQNIAGPYLRIEGASRDQLLQLNEQDLAPRIVVSRQGRTLLAIAHLDLEDYLCGVLAGEVPFNRWHPEALKAQAVTSRSYALHQMRKNSGNLYDVESTVMSQVFKPGFRNNPILSAAVSSTRGLALTDNGAVFSAYFHSTCGGHTENSGNVFPEAASIKALHGAACAFCKESPHYNWTWSLNKQVLQQKLAAAGHNVGAVSRVEFLDGNGAVIAVRNPPERTASVRIHHAGGVLPLQGNQFRLIVSARDLKSLLIEKTVDRGDSIEITGGGFGHGVGLCQFGSQGMALAGASYTAILGTYYPGAELTRVY
jgi:stage II sporulation protein D